MKNKNKLKYKSTYKTKNKTKNKPKYKPKNNPKYKNINKTNQRGGVIKLAPSLKKMLQIPGLKSRNSFLVFVSDSSKFRLAENLV